MKTIERLSSYLTKYNHIFPKIWQKLDKACWNRRDEGIRSDWCYCPLIYAADIIDENFNVDNNLFLSINDINITAGLAAWRTTQGIYRFHQEILDNVWQTPVCGPLPTEPFYRLPEWCCYVETPGKSVRNETLHGFFVFLNDNGQQNGAEIVLVLDLERDLLSWQIPLTGANIKDSLFSFYEKLSAQFTNFSKDDEHSQETVFSTLEINKFLAKSFAKDIEPVISTILYLCTQSAEIPEFESRTRPAYHARQQRIYSPEKPRVWEVAYRTGAMLELRRRRTSETTLESSTQGDESFQGRQAMRPHIRRAHWHGYWRGARKSNVREYSLKWLHPALVNVNNAHDIVPVTRQVS